MIMVRNLSHATAINSTGYSALPASYEIHSSIVTVIIYLYHMTVLLVFPFCNPHMAAEAIIMCMHA